MKLLQWIYTNVGGEAGFSTFFHSEELNADEIKELVKLFGRYELPLGVSLQPDAEEIAEKCPQLFYSVTLTTGRKAICQAKFLGNCWHDGRGGNFIAHALILDDGEWNVNVFDFIDSKLFLPDLPDDIKEVLKSAKSRNDKKSNMSEAIPLEDLKGNFLGKAFRVCMDQADRKEIMEVLLGRVLYREAETDCLIFSTAPMDAAATTAALAYLLPVSLLNKMNIVTYLQIARRPIDFYNKYSLLGTDSPIREGGSPVPVSAYIDACSQDKPNFFRLINSFGDVSTKEWNFLARCFLSMRSSGTKLNDGELLRFADLILQHRSAPGVEILSKQVEYITSFKTLSSICLALFQMGAETGKEYLTSELLFHFCTALIENSHGIAQTLNVFEEYDQKLSKRLAFCWTDASIFPKIITKILSKPDTDRTLAFLAITKRAFEKTGNSLKTARDKYPDEIQKTVISIFSSQTALTRLLNTYQTVDDIVQWWEILFRYDPLSTLVFQAIAQKLSSFTPANVRSVYKAMYDRGYGDAVLNDLYRQIETGSLAFYLANEEFIRKDLSKLYQEHGAALLSRVQFDNISTENASWLISCLKRPENHGARKSALDAICAALPITRPDAAVVELLKNISTMYQAIQEPPSVIVPILLLSQKDGTNVYSVFAQHRNVYDSLSKDRQKKMRSWLLPLMFEQATEAKFHEQIIHLFATENSEEEFVHEYMNVANKAFVSATLRNADQCFQSLLEYYLVCDDDHIELLLRECFAKIIFVKFNDDGFQGIERKFSFLKKLSGTEKKRWETLKKQVVENSRGFIAKLYFSLFGGK